MAASLSVTIGRLARGGGDPSVRHVGQLWWYASVTPEGPVLVQLAPEGADVRVGAWGAGAQWALEQAPRLLGAHDRPDGFRPEHPVVRELARRHPWLRIGATDRVCETLLPSVVEQRVTGAEAFRSIRQLTSRFGSPAPGPAQVLGHPAHGMLLPLTAGQWAAIPSWDYLRAGVEQTRSRTLVGAARRGSALERTLGRSDPGAALRSLPGVGSWTSARTLQHAFGDPDAWSSGDYHVPGAITFALTGEKLGQGEAEELLAQFEGHRYRVELLVLASARLPERRGPRRPLPTHLP